MVEPTSLKLLHCSILRRGCGHNIPISLRVRLSEPNWCPECQIIRHIKAIRDVQKGLEMRGGIFASKEKVLAESRARSHDTVVLGTQSKRHRAWLRKWRETKIKVLARLTEFEEFLEEMVEAEELNGVEEVKKAVGLWRDVEDEMAVMPGKFKDSDEDADEDKEEASSDSGDVPQLANDEINRRSAARVGVVLDITLGDGGATACAAPSKNVQVHNSRPDSENPQIATTSKQDTQQTPQDDFPLPNTPPTIKNILTTITLRSALRKPRIPKSPISTFSTLPSSPKVRIATTVTHVSHKIHPFRLSFLCDRPHQPYTSAEASRNPLLFQRTSKFYTDGTWTSPEGFEKVDTSFMSVDWENVPKF